MLTHQPLYDAYAACHVPPAPEAVLSAMEQFMGKARRVGVSSGFDRMLECRRALDALDRQGWERSYHQRQFHESFLRACSRIFWKTEPSGQFQRDHQKILQLNGWNHLSQVVLAAALAVSSPPVSLTPSAGARRRSWSPHPAGKWCCHPSIVGGEGKRGVCAHARGTSVNGTPKGNSDISLARAMRRLNYCGSASAGAGGSSSSSDVTNESSSEYSSSSSLSSSSSSSEESKLSSSSSLLSSSSVVVEKSDSLSITSSVSSMILFETPQSGGVAGPRERVFTIVAAPSSSSPGDDGTHVASSSSLSSDRVRLAGGEFSCPSIPRFIVARRSSSSSIVCCGGLLRLK